MMREDESVPFVTCTHINRLFIFSFAYAMQCLLRVRTVRSTYREEKAGRHSGKGNRVRFFFTILVDYLVSQLTGAEGPIWEGIAESPLLH
ncbi:hypothetical protein IF1G_04352 [Cordyceps javanica]|uniref:Uncharacterized protein n=1 Tax=Cordyceps javanica TaxID=43265 RepID=A0A545V5W4_9HYPO|nr:hypothetical protein IF1G_04352 [Cordyceps javanica]